MRRCVFHYIAFPKAAQLNEILQQRLAHLDVSQRLIEVATEKLFQLRSQAGIEKSPGTAELLDWVQILYQSGVDTENLAQQEQLGSLPGLGALLKNQQDLKLVSPSGL